MNEHTKGEERSPMTAVHLALETGVDHVKTPDEATKTNIPDVKSHEKA